jgi:D-sedoheptulose 7-phosphate isomerase/D-glycero-D-manno-heptose 1,7-bisphosphate phosphatase
MSTVHDHQVPAPATGDSRTGFPDEPYESLSAYFASYSQQATMAARTIAPRALDRAAAILLEAYTTGRRVFCCGNGGSAAIANHLQCDHLKGVRTATDLAPRVVSLSTSVELLTAIANDISYDQVFVYQLQSQAAPGDVLIAISSSGRSPSIVRAVTWARTHGLRTIALTGFDGGQARAAAEVSLHVAAMNYGVVEDQHQSIMHALAQFIRQSRMTPDAIASSIF